MTNRQTSGLRNSPAAPRIRPGTGSTDDTGHRRAGDIRRPSRPLERPLTWGQRAIWEVVRWLGARAGDLNMVEVCPLTAGTGLPAVTTALTRLLERHESLRTRMRDDGDGPRQDVTPSGAIPLTVRQDTRGTAPGAPRQERGDDLHRLVTELATPAFAPDELPVRAAVLCRDGEPAELVLVVSHLAVDGWSMAIVREELATLLAGAEPRPSHNSPSTAPATKPLPPPAPGKGGPRPLEHGGTRSAPGVAGRLTQGPRHGDLVCSEIDSAALGSAVAELAAQHKVTPSMVVQAGTALALCLDRGESEIGLRLIVATRYTTRTARFVGPLNQNALLRLPLRDESLADFFTRVRTASSSPSPPPSTTPSPWRTSWARPLRDAASAATDTASSTT
ncbi:condensation domain-containing protein [Streptomyces zhihengii]